MARVISIPIVAPGALGLATQNSASVLSPEWALVANNAVIDSDGRLAARNGWAKTHVTAISGSPAVEAIGEYLSLAGASTIVSAAGAKIYSGTSSLTDITGTLTPADNDWSFQRFNGKMIGFQGGETPIVWTGSGNFADIAVSGAGTLPTGHAGLCAFGRTWQVKSETDKTVIFYSDLLDETTMADSATPGSSGYIDLRTVWTGGMDEITALAEFNGHLIIFGKKHIVIYGDTGAGIDTTTTTTTPAGLDTSAIVLKDVIQGTGCIARDSVQNIGTDLLFLSDRGVMSLARVIQEKSMPMNEVTANLSDDIRNSIGLQTDMKKVRSAFDETSGLYLLSFPDEGKTYAIDIKFPIREQGRLRATSWDTINPTAMHAATDRVLYLGQAGFLASYTGYQDNGAGYQFQWWSPWINLQQLDQRLATKLKIFKQGVLTVGGVSTAVQLTWGVGYSTAFDSITKATPAASGGEWGLFEWGTDEYAGGASVATLKYPMGKTGDVFRGGVTATINNNAFSLQNLELKMKLGKI